MRWRSGSSREQLAHQMQQSGNDTSSDAEPRVDDDEQDYPDHHRYDDDEDDDDDVCDSAVGESSSLAGPPLASHHYDDLDDIGDLLQPKKTHGPASSALSLVSSLPPPDANPQLLPSTASCCAGNSSLHAHATSAASAVVIKDDGDDDPGFDHALPLDDSSGALSPTIAWVPQSHHSTCEFTHTIAHYSQKRESGCKKAEYSATTVDEFGNRWRLIVYVNGNGRASNHHLSLFLQVADADELPFGWKKAVSYVLTLEHPSGSSLGYAKRNPDKTFKLCPKAIDWGWSQFITSDRIQQEGYISNDSLTVRASVTVKSSSVSIDPEDAELYLKCAVEEGNADAVEACLAQGADVNCQFKDDLYTPLHTACSSSTSTGSLDVLRLLLRRGADGNACNKWRETPLLIAANNGHRAAVEALLESGADPSLCSEAGWSALTFAAHKGYDDIVALLLAAGAPVNCRVTEDLSTPLHKACAGGKPGHLSAVKQLIAGVADVHALNKWKETPLLTAANHGQAAAVEALLRAGGDPCRCTDTGWSPLSIAAYKGHDDVVRLLLEEGAPTEEEDPTLSALLQAATKGLPETVELLLRHGADHTVTTKKGDTALSILVEQNLIDAAVEMVTEYKASIPRCSRDRKKVQRARLLINLRVKQQQKEGMLNDSLDSDDDSDQDESDDDSNSALHDSDESSKAATPGSLRKKKKRKKITVKAREDAEAEAKAAAEALLLEIEQEMDKAQKDEAAASSKRNKKKKKKERERQQKLEEERLKREKEAKQAEERERLRQAKEEKERKEKEQREEEEKAKDMKEAAERAEKAATKRRERDERERRQRAQEKKDRERSGHLEKTTEAHATQVTTSTTSLEASPTEIETERVFLKSKGLKKYQTDVSKASYFTDKSTNKPFSAKALVPGVKFSDTFTNKRGWEKSSSFPAQQSQPVQHLVAQQSSRHKPPPSSPVSQLATPELLTHSATHLSFEQNQSNVGLFTVEDQLGGMANDVVDFLKFDSAPNGDSKSSQHLLPLSANKTAILPTVEKDDYLPSQYRSRHMSVLSVGSFSDTSLKFAPGSTDLPAVVVYQQEKVSELIRRCLLARSASTSSRPNPLSIIDDRTVKAVIYKWIVRAAHGSSQFLDPIIPSWTDIDVLGAFLQRQFISENRRGMGAPGAGGIVSIEMLKEAGSVMTELCRTLAKELSDFRNKYKKQVPRDWSDATMNVGASEMMVNGGGSRVVVIDWAGRSQAYVPSSAFLDLTDRYQGPPSRYLTAIFAVVKRYETLRMIVSGTSMDYRLSLTTRTCLVRELKISVELWSDPIAVLGNNAFCAMLPDIDTVFGALLPFGKEGGGGEVALLKHGGSVAVLPPLESTVASCYVRHMLDLLESTERTGVPLSFALFLPMECFRELTSAPTPKDLHLLDPRLANQVFFRGVELLPPGQHAYHCGADNGHPEICQTGSIFLLLQNDSGRRHFSVDEKSFANIVRSTTVNFASFSDRSPTTTVFSSVRENPPSHSPIPNNVGNEDFGSFNGALASDGFGSDQKRGSRRRGRLFELVDDDDDDNGTDVDLVSGMLNRLDVSMFHNNAPQDVDIEAISLMGIGGSSLGRYSSSLGRQGRLG